MTPRDSKRNLRDWAKGEARGDRTGADRLSSLPPEAKDVLIEELHLYQTELKLQNDQLRQHQEVLQALQDKYFDLYDLAPCGYITIDSRGLITEANLTAAGLWGRAKQRLINTPFTRLIHPEDQDLYHLHCRQHSETQKEAACELRMVKQDGTTFWAWVEASETRETGSGPRGSRVAISDITARRMAEQALQETMRRLRLAMQTTVQVLVLAVETKDPYTAGHQRVVANLARAIAGEMGLSAHMCDGMRLAGTVHDIGKITLPMELLSKPTRLTALEYDLVKEHARQGGEILQDVDSPWPLAQIVHQHHERLDGSGYPRGLRGEDILLEARILSVADVVEAMASRRPYRPPLGMEAALLEIETNRGRLYDPEAAEACLRLIREEGFRLDCGVYPLEASLIR